MTTLSIAEVAQVAYTECVIRLDDMARDMSAAGQPINAAKIRHQAAIAYRAARAEKLNPPSPGLQSDLPAPACSICGGVTVCDPRVLR